MEPRSERPPTSSAGRVGPLHPNGLPTPTTPGHSLTHSNSYDVSAPGVGWSQWQFTGDNDVQSATVSAEASTSQLVASEAAPVKQKRAYGKSCAACKRRKRKCPGRDENGVSLCTYCKDAGIPCEYGVSRDAYRLERAETDAARVRELIARANATPDPIDRQRLLDEALREPAPAFKKRRSRNAASIGPSSDTYTSTSATYDSGVRPGSSPKTLLGSSIGSVQKADKRKRDSFASLAHNQLTYDPSIHLIPPDTVKGEDPDEYGYETSSSDASLNGAGRDDPNHSSSQTQQRAGIQERVTTGQQSRDSHPSIEEKAAAILVDAVGGRARYTNLPSLPTSNATSQNINEVLAWAMPLCLWEDPVTAAQQRELNEYFLCWLNPMFEVVKREQLDDPTTFYQTAGLDASAHDFLLSCLDAYVALYCPGYSHRARSFAVRAHLLLATELAKPSSPTCVQGLILLAVHHYGTGGYSQCRHLTSTAVGMFDNLMHAHTGQEVPAPSFINGHNGYHGGFDGLHRNGSVVLSRDYRQLYWSLFIMDRLNSLCFNRYPFLRKRDVALPDMPDSPVLWKPVLPAVEGQFGLPMPLYPPINGRAGTCFKEKCVAMSFLDEILNRIYSYARALDRPPSEKLVVGIRDRMSAWQAKVSPALHLNAEHLPSQAPSPNVVYFNLLTRSAWILLYRPFYSAQPASIPGAREVCERCAYEICAILTLFRATFGSLRQSYIFIYSLYWATHVLIAIAAREGQTEDLVSRLTYMRELLTEWVNQPIHDQACAPLIQLIDNFLGWSPASAVQALAPAALTFDPFEGLYFSTELL